MPARIFASITSPSLFEGIAVDALKPGQMAARKTTAGVEELITSQQPSTLIGLEMLVVKEVPSTLGGELITTPWVIGEVAETIAPKTGEWVWLSMANTQNFTDKGTPVTHNGDGDFKIGLIDGTEQIYAVNEQIINVTAAQTLVLCRKT